MRERLPSSLQVFERGWLSSNNVLCIDSDGWTLIDSGYGAHTEQTLALVEHRLGGAALDRIINTHCHSDHIGANAALRQRHHCAIWLPQGEAPIIERWNEDELMLRYADQHAERFAFDRVIAADQVLRFGDIEWQALAAPGHDRHALLYFAPDERVLIAGDALWESGFGVIFPALFGDASAFAESRQTLDRISALGARVVIPGHGRVFSSVAQALERAYFKLDSYEEDPERLGRHAAKVMLSFALMEKRAMPMASLPSYVERVGILRDINARYFRWTAQALAQWLADELVRAGAALVQEGMLRPRAN